MTTKDRLKAYRDTCRRIKLLEEQIEQLYSSINKMRENFDNNLGVKVQMSGVHDPFGDVMAKLIDKGSALADELDKEKIEREEIQGLLTGLLPRERLLVVLRYFEGYTWQQVADELDVSYSRIVHFHGEVLQKL
jgi:RNA polymerase sigma factor (sigma-70 family)